MKITEIKNRLEDIINFDYSVLHIISDVFVEMDEILETYQTNVGDIQTLEEMKRTVAGNLVYFSKLFGEVKKFKGTNHIYLADARKRIKAQTLKLMEGSTSANRELVYDHPNFTSKMEAIEFLKRQFITIEELYNNYEKLFNGIVQSISKETKTFQGV